MKKFILNTIHYLCFGLVFLLVFQTNAQKLSIISNIIDNNIPILDSVEKASLPKMVLLENALSIENPSQRKYKNKVEIKLFQEVNALRFKLYVDNKFKQKVVIKVLDGRGITIFEDTPSENKKYQRLYNMTFLTNKAEYYFTAFYDNQDHYFFPIRLESKQILEEVAKLSTEYPIEKGKN